MMNLICQLSAPPYAIKCLSNGYFIIAGGGGAAKTGVKNFVALYQLRKRDSGEFYAIMLHEHTPEGCAIMNFAAIGQAETCVLLLGEDMFCKEYLLRRKFISTERPLSSSEFPTGRSRSRSASGTLRYRGLSMSEEAPNPEETLFELIELRRVQTCSKPQAVTVTSQPITKKNEDDTYQTCVRLSSDLTYLITGCSDGQVNVHRYVDDVLPTVRSFHVLPVTATGGKIGSGENVAIEDLDVSPSFGTHAELSVVASGSARCAVHRVADGAPIKELSLDERAAADCGAFRFRNVRYSVYVSEESARSNRNRVLLISTHRRLKQTRADRRAFLVAAWSCSVYGANDEVSPATTHKLKHIQYPFVGCIRVYDDDPATLAVNDNGHLVGVGTQDGAVHVLRLNYTQVDAPDGRTVDAQASFFPIYRVRDVHATFVTGIAFLPTAVSDQERCDALLLSQSVDLRVMSHAVHALSPRRAALERAASIATICIRLLVALLAIYVFFLVAARAFVAIHDGDGNLGTDTNNWTTANPGWSPNAVDDTRHPLEPGHSEAHTDL